jgi:hypothetical protein
MDAAARTARRRPRAAGRVMVFGRSTKEWDTVTSMWLYDRGGALRFSDRVDGTSRALWTEADAYWRERAGCIGERVALPAQGAGAR